MKQQRILFLTGTRADYGKLKPLIKQADTSDVLDCTVCITGMHTLEKYGRTEKEISRDGYAHTYTFTNQKDGDSMDVILANTIHGLAAFLREHPQDMIVVHGDRLEALAGAVVGAFNNILVAHVEGGEVSGTVDGVLRHAITKLSHIHFVANDEAARRVEQLGEPRDSVFVIGSPDLDLMLSPDLPALEDVRKRYDIPFSEYGIATYHPVTTEVDQAKQHADQFVDALLRSERSFVIIHPNNDRGAHFIFDAYQKLEGNERFRLLPSMRFEYFLSLLKHAQCMVGNSSAGVREAPFYGIPSVDVGTRQSGRFAGPSVMHVPYDTAAITAAITDAYTKNHFSPNNHFGTGKSAENFLKTLLNPKLWTLSRQKLFVDLPMPPASHA